MLSSTVAPRCTSDRLKIVSRTRIELLPIEQPSPRRSPSPSSFRSLHLETNSVETPSAATSHVIDSIPYIHIRLIKAYEYRFLFRRKTRPTMIHGYGKDRKNRRGGMTFVTRGMPEQNKSKTEGTTLRTRWPVAD